MAKGLTLGNYIDKPKKKRPGVHAKSKTSKIKIVKITSRPTEVKVNKYLYT
jgi:hypothetical protein